MNKSFSINIYAIIKGTRLLLKIIIFLLINRHPKYGTSHIFLLASIIWKRKDTFLFLLLKSIENIWNTMAWERFEFGLFTRQKRPSASDSRSSVGVFVDFVKVKPLAIHIFGNYFRKGNHNTAHSGASWKNAFFIDDAHFKFLVVQLRSFDFVVKGLFVLWRYCVLFCVRFSLGLFWAVW